MSKPIVDKQPKPTGKRRVLSWTRDILALIVVVALVQWWQSRDLVHGSAPPLVGHLVNGEPFQLNAAEGPYLVHFWATWCPICRLEQDTIDAIAGDLPVMTVATTSGTAAEMAEYLQTAALTMPVMLDEDGAVARAWGVNGVPASFVINTDGTIDHAGRGYSTELGLRLRLWFAD
jgi:thiol-disulfide isomerase/thioredoxin